MMIESALPAGAWTVALLSLPKLGPNRLQKLLGSVSPPRCSNPGPRAPELVWRRLVDGAPIALEGVPASVVGEWRRVARATEVADQWGAIRNLGIEVMQRHGGMYPDRLEGDIDPPAVLFAVGDGHQAVASATPSVAIVGTRKCTSYGHRVAFELGAALADSGVSVISGLAEGIDAAAHRGALSAQGSGSGRPVGVVGSGLDVIYPRRNADLWAAVPEAGLLLSETPPGVGPERWRFPARNRIIAGLSDAVIVIESHERGGSLLTVDEAQLRDVPVGAIPGPITSNAAAGTNRLLVDGATPVLNVSDVHALIGHSPPRRREVPDADDVASELLDSMGWTPVSFDQLSARIGLPAAQVASQIEHLVAEGLCARNGVWIERVR